MDQHSEKGKTWIFFVLRFFSFSFLIASIASFLQQAEELFEPSNFSAILSILLGMVVGYATRSFKTLHSFLIGLGFFLSLFIPRFSTYFILLVYGYSLMIVYHWIETLVRAKRTSLCIRASDRLWMAIELYMIIGVYGELGLLSFLLALAFLLGGLKIVLGSSPALRLFAILQTSVLVYLKSQSFLLSILVACLIDELLAKK